MDIKLFVEHIYDLVAKNELRNAIELLLKLLKNSPKLNDVILQSSRLTDIVQQIRNGEVTSENANVTKNQIRLGILSLASEIEECILSNKDLEEEIKQAKAENYSSFIQMIHHGSGDNVGGNKIVNK